MTSVTQVVSYTDNILDNLTHQFQGKENISKLVGMIGEELDDVESAFFQLLNEVSLRNAIGKQLDDLGVKLDLSRSGRTDEEYRAALYVKIAINNSSGTPDQVISLSKLILDIDDIEYREIYPAHIRLNVYGDFPSVISTQQMRQLRPVGVGGIELLSWGDEVSAFSFSTTDGPQDDPSAYADGFGTTDDPTLGGVMSSIYEVIS